MVIIHNTSYIMRNMKRNILLLALLLSLSAGSIYALGLNGRGCLVVQQAKPTDCNAKLKQLIVTCPNFKNPFQKELSARIEKNEGEVYTIELFVKSSGENSANPVGWVKLNVKNHTLTDITYDPDDGVALKYNKALYDSFLTDCLKIKPGE